MTIGIFIVLLSLTESSREIEETSVEASHAQEVTVLDLGSSNRHIEVVKFLFNANANIDAVDNEYRQTPLSWAAQKGHVDVVKLLLNANANTEAANNTYR